MIRAGWGIACLVFSFCERALGAAQTRQGSALHPLKNLRFLRISLLLPRLGAMYCAARERPA